MRARLIALYPHAVEEERGDAFGQAVFSWLPLSAVRQYPPGAGFTTPQISVEVEHAGRPLRVLNVHLLAPLRPWVYAEQRREAAGLATWAALGPGSGAPDVMIGDFNGVPEAPTLRATRVAGMRDAHAEAGWWRGSTWPRTSWLKRLPGVRLDQALVGERVECVESRVLGDNGSDHSPIVVKVRWRD